MFRKKLTWRRWTGYRSDLLRAVTVASDELEVWTGVPSAVGVDVNYTDDLSEQSASLADFERLDTEELRRVKSLSIEVEPDGDAWSQQQTAGEYRPRPNARVRFHLWDVIGAEAVVTGDRRTQVEGLAMQLREVLRHGAPPLYRADTSIGAFIALWPLVILGLFVGDRVPEWIGVSTANNDVDRWEALGIGIGVLCAIVIAAGIYLAFPMLEILPDGAHPRHRRLRRVVAGIAGALAITFIGVALGHVF
jgi:hypothetical protein